MKMKQLIVTIAAAAMTITATAQSLDEGMKMYRYERYASAKKILQPLAATDPMANYYYGLSELELGNTDAAMAAFVKYPEDFANISGTVRVKFAVEGEAAGMQAAQALADMGKKKEWVQKRYAADAINYSKGGNKQLAVDWYTEVLEKMITPELLVATGDAYLQLPSGGGQAMTHYEKAVEKDPNNSLAYSRMGKLMYNARNYDKALEHWKKAQETDPTNPLPYRDMAMAYAYVGKYELAKENMEKYLQYSDKSMSDQYTYAEILYSAKYFPEAIAKINELKAQGLNKVEHYGILAYSYLDVKDSTAAAKSLENARTYFAKQKPERLFAQDYLKLGQIYLRNDIGDSANIAFSKALSMDTTGDRIATYRDIAESFRTNRDWVNAGKWYEKIYAEFGDKALAADYVWGGISYFYASAIPGIDTLKVLTTADTIMGSMIAKFPEQPSGYYWRGRINMAIDNEAKTGAAKPYFEQWLAMDTEGAPKNDRDLLYAYQYLALYHYNKEDKPNTITWAEKVLVIDANNKFAKDLLDWAKKKV